MKGDRVEKICVAMFIVLQLIVACLYVYQAYVNYQICQTCY